MTKYIKDEQTKIFNKLGVFFAYSEDQFNKSADPDISYTKCSYGMICPTENLDELYSSLDKIYEKGIEKDIQENGLRKIIWRELANHEAQITYDLSDTISALEGYGISNELFQDVWCEYRDYCIEHDLF